MTTAIMEGNDLFCNEAKLRELFVAVADYPDFIGIDVDSVDVIGNFGNSLLNFMVIKGDADAVRLLVSCGANVNFHGDDGYTPLHDAIEGGYVDIVRILVDSGADIYSVNRDSVTPYEMAKNYNNLNIMNLLNNYLKI